MLKVMRNDGLYYGVAEEGGHYYVGLYNQEDKEIDSFVIAFTTQREAYQAAQIAERAFAQGQQSVLERR